MLKWSHLFTLYCTLSHLSAPFRLPRPAQRPLQASQGSVNHTYWVISTVYTRIHKPLQRGLCALFSTRLILHGHPSSVINHAVNYSYKFSSGPHARWLLRLLCAILVLLWIPLLVPLQNTLHIQLLERSHSIHHPRLHESAIRDMLCWDLTIPRSQFDTVHASRIYLPAQ